MSDDVDQVDLWMDRAMGEMDLRLECEAEITRLRAAHTKVGKFRIDGFESRYDLVPLQKEPDHE